MKHRSIPRTALWLPVVVLFAGLHAIPAQADQWFGEPIVTEVDNNFGWDLEVGDLNRDGYDDFVPSNAGGGWLFVCLSDTTGHFAVVDTLPKQAGGHNYSLIDEDCDGFPDLVVAGSIWGCYLWRNDGTGHFTNTGRLFEGLSQLAVGDVDLDGYVDLIISSDPWVKVYYGSESDLGSNPQYLEFIFEIWPPEAIAISFIKIGDLDGDSVNDVILSGDSGEDIPPRASPPVSQADAATIRWRLGLGNREFAPVRAHMLEGEGTEYGPFDLGDLDNDGDSDVVARYWGYPTLNTQVLFYDEIYDKLIVADSSLALGIPELADLDEDGRLDLSLCFGGSQRTHVYHGLGGAEFEYVQTLVGTAASRLGTVVSDPGPDMISVGETPIALWPNQIHEPSAADDPAIQERMGGAFWIWPFVATREAWIHWDAPQRIPVQVEVVDIQGRIIRRMRTERFPHQWDLRDGQGAALGSGIYWLRLRAGNLHTQTARLAVLR